MYFIIAFIHLLSQTFKQNLFNYFPYNPLNQTKTMDCKLYNLFISAFSVVFLLYLFFLVAFDSETLYIEVHNRLASAFALFMGAVIYACIFAYLYYDRYINIDRKEDLKRWLRERKQQHKKEREMRVRERQSQIATSMRESSMQ